MHIMSSRLSVTVFMSLIGQDASHAGAPDIISNYTDLLVNWSATLQGSISEESDISDS